MELPVYTYWYWKVSILIDTGMYQYFLIVNWKVSILIDIGKYRYFFHTKNVATLEIMELDVKARPHYAVRQNATHCNFAERQKLLSICRQCNRIHMKREFFADPLQVTKNVERDWWTLSDFFLKLANTILKLLTHHMPHSFLWWNWQFANRIFRPCSIKWHAAAEQT